MKNKFFLLAITFCLPIYSQEVFVRNIGHYEEKTVLRWSTPKLIAPEHAKRHQVIAGTQLFKSVKKEEREVQSQVFMRELYINLAWLEK